MSIDYTQLGSPREWKSTIGVSKEEFTEISKISNNKVSNYRGVGGLHLFDLDSTETRNKIVNYNVLLDVCAILFTTLVICIFCCSTIVFRRNIY